jgi:capping protein alpha
MEDRIGGQQTTMEDRVAENGEDEFAELGADQKVALGKWFLLNSPPGQVQQVAKGNP